MTRGVCRTVALAAWIALISLPAFGQDAGALDPEAREAIGKAIDLSHQPRRRDISAEDGAVIAEAIRTKRALRDAARSSSAVSSRADDVGRTADGQLRDSTLDHGGTLRAQAAQIQMVLKNVPSGAESSSEVTRLRERLADYARELNAIESMTGSVERQKRLRQLIEQSESAGETPSAQSPLLRTWMPSNQNEDVEIPDSMVQYGR